jgi:hypothetical protein
VRRYAVPVSISAVTGKPVLLRVPVAAGTAVVRTDVALIPLKRAVLAKLGVALITLAYLIGEAVHALTAVRDQRRVVAKRRSNALTASALFRMNAARKILSPQSQFALAMGFVPLT